MAGGLGNLFITVGADIAGFSSAMGNVNDQLRGAVREVEKTTAGWSKAFSSMQTVGIGMSAAITAPILGIGAASLMAFGDFESSMNRVSALGDITGSSLDKLKAQAIDLGAKTQFSAKQAADGMAELSAAGFNATQIMQAMPGVLSLAAAGQLSVGQAAEIAANLMGGFGISADGIGRATDVIAKAAASGSVSVQDLAYTFKYVGPIAKAAGIGFEEVAAATTLLSNAGLKGEQAGTGLRGMMASLIDPSKQAAEAMAKLGLVATDSTGKLLPLENIVGQLGARGATTKDIFAIFGRETAAAVSALVNTGAPALRTMTAELINSEGAAAKMAGTMNKGLSGALERMKGSVETAAISLGEALAPVALRVAGAVESLANKASELFAWFGKLPEPVQNIALGFTALLAAAGPLLLAVGTMGQAFIGVQAAMAIAGPVLSAFGTIAAGLAAPIGIAVLAVAALGTAAYLIYDNWTDVKATLAGLWTDISNIASAIFGPIVAFLSGAFNGVASAWTKVWTAMKDFLGAVWTNVADIAKGIWEWIVNKLNWALEQLGKILPSTAAALKNWGKGGVDAAKGVDAATESSKRLVDAQIAVQKATTGAVASKEKLSGASKKAAAAATTLAKKQVELAAKTKLAEKQFEAIEERMDGLNAIKQMKSFFPAEWFKSQKDAFKLLEKLGEQMDEVQTKQRGSINVEFARQQLKPLVDLSAAYKTLGISIQDAGIAERSALQQKADDAKKAYDLIAGSGTASAENIKKAFNALKDAQIAASKEARDKITLENTGLGDFLHAKFSGLAEDIKKPFEGAFDSVKKSLGSFGANFSNALLGAGSISEVFSAAGTNLLNAFKNSFDLIKGKAMEFLGDLVQSFINWGLDKLKDFVTGMLDSVTNGFVTKLSEKLAVALGGDAASAAATAAGGAASAAGGASSAAGSVASAVSSGITGMVNMISGIATSVSSVISNFQQMGMNKTLDLLEHEMRFAQIHLGHILDKANEWWPKSAHLFDIWGEIGISNNHLTNILGKLYDINLSLFELPMRLQEQFSGTGSMAGMEAVGGGGGVTIILDHPTFLNDRQVDGIMGTITRRMKSRNA